MKPISITVQLMAKIGYSHPNFGPNFTILTTKIWTRFRANSGRVLFFDQKLDYI